MDCKFTERLARLEHALSETLAARGGPEQRSALLKALFDGEPMRDKDVRGLGPGPVACLVAFDADRIQEFVFASERPQVSAGASWVLEDVNARVLREIGLPNGVLGCVYSAGGVGLLLASGAGDPRNLETACREWLERDAHGLTFTVCAIPVLPSDLAASADASVGRFTIRRGGRGVFARLAGQLRAMKALRVPESDPTGLPANVPQRAAARCPSCGRRAPVAGNVPRADEAPWCDFCMALRRVCVLDPRRQASIRYDELAQRSAAPRKHLAFLALDGNDMGSLLRDLSSLRQVAAFSEGLSQVFEAARTQARGVVENVPQAYGEKLRPEYDTISLLSGGDEVALILPAAAAWEAARTALNAVESGLEALAHDAAVREAFRGRADPLERLGKGGSCAGLVFSRPTFPVRLLRRHAAGLVTLAKRKRDANARSALCALSLIDGSALPDVLSEDHASLDGVQVLRSPTDLGEFLQELHTLAHRRVPRSLLQGLWAAVAGEHAGPTVAQGAPLADPVGAARASANFFRYQLARHEDTLGSWWDALGRNREDHVEAWFQQERRLRLRHLLDALALSPARARPA